MQPGRLPFDQNRIRVSGGISDSGPETILPLEVNSNGGLDVNIVGGGGSGGTASTFGATFPSVGTAVGATNGTNMEPLAVDGSGNLLVNVAAGGTSGTQYTDGSVTATHPIGTIPVFNNGGTITAVSAANPLPVSATISTAGLATSANQTNNSQTSQIVNSSGNPITSTNVNGTTQSLNVFVENATAGSLLGRVNLYDSTNTNAAAVNGSGALTISNTAFTANAGTNLNTSLLALESGGNLAAIKTDTDKIPSQGQALAASSMPVVLPALQVTALTPPSNTGYALDSSLTTIDTDLKSNITLHAGTNLIGKVGIDQTTVGTTNAVSIAQIGTSTLTIGQQTAGNSIPVILPSATITTLTPPAAITNYANETGGNLATLAGTVTSSILQSNIKQINGVVPLMGNGVTGTGSQRVTIASDNTAFSVNATLSAETTKVIGSVNVSAGQTIAVTNVGTFATQSTLSAETTKVIGVVRAADGSGNLLTSTTNALDINIKSGSIANTSFAATQATASSLNATVVPGNATAATAPAVAMESGAIASTSLPTAVTNGQLVGAMADKFGRQVTLPFGTRDIVLPMTQLTLTASTSETTLIGQVASTFLDIISVVVINTSATATQVDFRDSTGGTVRLSLYVPAGDTRGIALPTPLPQATVNNNWTAKCGTSVSSVIITGSYITNK